MCTSLYLVGETQNNPMIFKRAVNCEVQLLYISPENILENQCYVTCFELEIN